MKVKAITLWVLMFSASTQFAGASEFGVEPTPGDYFQENLTNLIGAAMNYKQRKADFEHELRHARLQYFTTKPGDATYKKAKDEYEEILTAQDLSLLSFCIGEGYPKCLPYLTVFQAGDGVDEQAIPTFAKWVNAVRSSLPQTTFFGQDIRTPDIRELKAALAKHTAEYIEYAKIRDSLDLRKWRLDNPTDKEVKEIITPCNKQVDELIGAGAEGNKFRQKLFLDCYDKNGTLPQESKTWYRDVGAREIQSDLLQQAQIKAAQEAKAKEQSALQFVSQDCNQKYQNRNTNYQAQLAFLQCLREGSQRVKGQSEGATSPSSAGRSNSPQFSNANQPAALDRNARIAQQQALQAKIRACSDRLHSVRPTSREEQKNNVDEYRACIKEARTAP